MASIIKIKRSDGTNAPSALAIGELAITYGHGGADGGKIFFGADTNDIRVVGGQRYVDSLEAATDQNAFDAIVKRDSSGNFIANVITAALSGNADTATKLQTPVNINLLGDVTGSVSFDGSQSIDITTTVVNGGGGGSSNKNPQFSYSSGLLSRVDYDNQYKTFEYIDGLLDSVKSYDINNIIIKTKNFFYDVNDNLVRIEEV